MSILDSLWRIHQQVSYHRQWFFVDKPARIKAGAGPDGLWPEERSEADKERLPYANSCVPEFRRLLGR